MILIRISNVLCSERSEKNNFDFLIKYVKKKKMINTNIKIKYSNFYRDFSFIFIKIWLFYLERFKVVVQLNRLELCKKTIVGIPLVTVISGIVRYLANI